MENDHFKGYRGEARGVLQRFNVKVWSDVEIKSKKGTLKG